jgi:hypothetical protein
VFLDNLEVAVHFPIGDVPAELPLLPLSRSGKMIHNINAKNFKISKLQKHVLLNPSRSA